MSNDSAINSVAARRRAAKHLEGLYGMVIAVGLGIAVVNTLPSVHDRLEIAWDHVPLVAALLVTLVPFYQGALLHLDAKYERPTGRRHPTFLLLLDFIGLFFEAVVIVALAVSVGDVHSFVIGVTVLLVVDVVWATLAWRLGGEAGKLRSWIRINLTVLAVLGLGLLSSIWVDYADESWTAAIVLVAFLRSGVDYWLNWDFYGGQDATAA
jgi:hypothetical protein